MPQLITEKKALSQFLISYCSKWEPVSQQFYSTVVGVQPGQRGWQAKCVKFIGWLCEKYSPSWPPEPTIRSWITDDYLPPGWDGWLYLVEKQINR